MAEDLVKTRDVKRGPVLVVTGANGQPAPEVPVLVVGVKVSRKETQLREEQNAPEIGNKHVTSVDVPLIASMSGLPGPAVIAV